MLYIMTPKIESLLREEKLKCDYFMHVETKTTNKVFANNRNYNLMHVFFSFSLAESKPRDLQITAYK